MGYVVMDMEWNQAMSSQSAVFNKLPIHLRGEIIQIGAIKLTDDLMPGDEFQIDVKPVYFKRMHYKVEKLTGFDKERLQGGVCFKEAFTQFREWCGENCTFLTWGSDDKAIMEQNIIIHDLDWDWISGWVNLQLIYNVQTGGDKNQKSLSTAMEYFEIEQTRVAHDALGDAYNTALVCTHLDMGSGLEHYDDCVRILSARAPGERRTPVTDGPEPLEHRVFPDYISKAEAFSDEALTGIVCPVCGGAAPGLRWVNQGDQRYMNLCSCPEHGNYLVRVKFRKTDDDTWCANRLIYEADDALTDFYKLKSTQSRRRGRGHSSRKNRPAK